MKLEICNKRKCGKLLNMLKLMLPINAFNKATLLQEKKDEDIISYKRYNILQQCIKIKQATCEKYYIIWTKKIEPKNTNLA
jgi:hypothetical protein